MAKKEEKVKRHFFKDFKAELKKVVWPTPKQVVNNTIAVVVIVIITAIIVFVLDTVFDLANTLGINKLKASIRNQVSVSEENYIDSEDNIISTNVAENTTSVKE